MGPTVPTICVYLLLAYVGSTSQPRLQAGTLTISLTGFKHDRGSAMVALTTAKSFLARTGAVRAESVRIQASEAICTFRDVPYGDYAVQAYHDENGNKRLDANALGIPSEPYGFSRDARGTFGPPEYADARFDFRMPEMAVKVHVQ
jgi:uncharacterized protein (DUF2141 family)